VAEGEGREVGGLKGGEGGKGFVVEKGTSAKKE